MMDEAIVRVCVRTRKVCKDLHASKTTRHMHFVWSAKEGFHSSFDLQPTNQPFQRTYRDRSAVHIATVAKLETTATKHNASMRTQTSQAAA